MSKRFRPSNGTLYALLLAGQTIAASALFMKVFPIFHDVLTHLGERLTLDIADQISITAVAVTLHCCYWIRLGWVTVTVPFKSTLISHLCIFIGRLSFLFGGALFSAVFFRHVPELDVLPTFEQSAVKLSYIALILFGLFCYSLELDRLGKALEPDPL
ncbi:hypothetical protein FP026_25375 [Rhizobium tropici]|uniref:Uncharacterized protein n=1 Tax=Rhizobium tropici TaxID=398 RepID=A0A5B0VSF5_RHITR|nr:hypothetical protein [Rhizobium tropici]KAA1177228.1 hypothetical protein FP026_25375 [Rhizobium tropici]